MGVSPAVAGASRPCTLMAGTAMPGDMAGARRSRDSGRDARGTTPSSPSPSSLTKSYKLVECRDVIPKFYVRLSGGEHSSAEPHVLYGLGLPCPRAPQGVPPQMAQSGGGRDDGVELGLSPARAALMGGPTVNLAVGDRRFSAPASRPALRVPP